MKKGMKILITVAVILVIVFAIFKFFAGTYNTMVSMDEGVLSQWAQVENQYQRRLDLIPNLVETVKGYAKHESETLEAVIKARNMAMNATDAKERAQDENILTGTLKTLFAVSEASPDLKANINFLELQQELTDTESKIQAARQFYNSSVMGLNTKIEMFPSNLIAEMFNFKPAEYFELDEAEKEVVKQAPKVSF